MFLFTILIFAQAENIPKNSTNLQTCTAGNIVKVDSIVFSNFPPKGNSLTFEFKGTLMYPELVDQANIILNGNNGFSSQQEVDFCLPPEPYPPIEFSTSISVSNSNYVSYVMKIYIGNCFEYFGCFQETFAIWKNI